MCVGGGGEKGGGEGGKVKFHTFNIKGETHS